MSGSIARRPRRFRLPASRRTFARVALSRGRGAPALARSGVVSLRTGRAAGDPDTIVPPGGAITAATTTAAPPHGGHAATAERQPSGQVCTGSLACM